MIKPIYQIAKRLNSDQEIYCPILEYHNFYFQGASVLNITGILSLVQATQWNGDCSMRRKKRAKSFVNSGLFYP